ncbi:MAG: hypothetical protein WB988_00940, partial [Candidatus Nitrosopolaris sp.]
CHRYGAPHRRQEWRVNLIRTKSWLKHSRCNYREERLIKIILFKVKVIIGRCCSECSISMTESVLANMFCSDAFSIAVSGISNIKTKYKKIIWMSFNEAQQRERIPGCFEL